MTHGLSPYPDYRESELPWVGRYPSHWSLRRTKSLFQERIQKGYPNEPLLAATQSMGVVRKADYANRTVTAQKDLHLLKLVEPGDYVISLRSFQGGIEFAHHRGIISPAYTVLKPLAGADTGYYSLYFKSRQFIDSLSLFVTGIREGQNIDYERLSRVPLPYPPSEEQAAIVRFLDHANRKIDGFIRAKRDLIGRLNERKQAIIENAVKCGVSPEVQCKPSTIPWLEVIPAHWSTTRLKFEAAHIVDCLHATPTYRPDGRFPAIRTADIEPGKVRLERARRISRSEFSRWTERLVPKAGDILYSREGERYGIAALVPKGVSLCISQRMMVFRIKPTQCSEYIMWQLNCRHVYLQASTEIIGSTSPHVNIEQIKNFQLALPPIDEQLAIVAHITDETAPVINAIVRTEREMTLMQEYRTRLIADIVTGKLDVRETAAKLPQLPLSQEPDALDEDSLDELEEGGSS